MILHTAYTCVCIDIYFFLFHVIFDLLGLSSHSVDASTVVEARKKPELPVTPKPYAPSSGQCQAVQGKKKICDLLLGHVLEVISKSWNFLPREIFFAKVLEEVMKVSINFEFTCKQLAHTHTTV